MSKITNTLISKHINPVQITIPDPDIFTSITGYQVWGSLGDPQPHLWRVGIQCAMPSEWGHDYVCRDYDAETGTGTWLHCAHNIMRVSTPRGSGVPNDFFTHHLNAAVLMCIAVQGIKKQLTVATE